VTVRARTNGALTIGAVVAVAGVAAAALAVYQFKPTPGVTFLVLGWMSILAAGFFLSRAVQSFDLTAGGTEQVSESRRQELVTEKKLLLKAIKEVEFDRDTDKLDQREAAEAIARYRARAVEILRLLEEDPERRYTAAIESELARRLAREEVDDRACASCKTVNDADAAFCKKCGRELGGAA
jgi:hypothetical protein